jgi:hypothetical protein
MDKNIGIEEINVEPFVIGRSTFVVNDSLVNSFHPKRTSLDLNSFIQVFRKRMRQTTIAK